MEKVTTAKAKNEKKSTTSKKAESKPKQAEPQKKSTTTIDEILNPSASQRIKKLETLNILAEKLEKVETKHDELTHFLASNDGNQSKMEFSADNNYRFTVGNPIIINKILAFVDTELSELKTKTENEVLNFQI